MSDELFLMVGVIGPFICLGLGAYAGYLKGREDERKEQDRE